VSAVAPASTRRARRAPETTRPENEPRRAEGARRPATRPRRLPAASAILVGICALLLAGIVAVQVAALRQNIERGELERTRQNLVRQNLDLSAQLDAAMSQEAISSRAVQLGMYLPPAGSLTYLARRG
jgi:hypothetical protein